MSAENRFKQAAEHLNRRLRREAGESVLWRGDGTECRALSACVGRTVFRSRDGYGLTVLTESRDFLIAASDLTEDPQPGDLLEWNGETYETAAPSGEACWRWSDPLKTVRRIHTHPLP